MKKTLTLLPAILLTTWLGCGGNQEATAPAKTVVNDENAEKTKGIIGTLCLKKQKMNIIKLLIMILKIYQNSFIKL